MQAGTAGPLMQAGLYLTPAVSSLPYEKCRTFGKSGVLRWAQWDAPGGPKAKRARTARAEGARGHAGGGPYSPRSTPESPGGRVMPPPVQKPLIISGIHGIIISC